MCLIAFAWRRNHDLPLALCANRDEFYARPSQSAHQWTDHPPVFAGRDLQAGGTWMGLADGGRFAAVTNIRDPSRNNPDAHSRGQLVSDFLLSSLSPAEFCRALAPRSKHYNGFNLLLCDGREMFYFNNLEQQGQRLPPGIYGLSNALLDTPWPKTLQARRRLRGWLDEPSAIESLARLLDDEQPADDLQLPDTGIDPALEKSLSAQFIRLEHYGTRCSSALLVDGSGTASFCELSFDRGRPAGTVKQHFPALFPDPQE